MALSKIDIETLKRIARGLVHPPDEYGFRDRDLTAAMQARVKGLLRGRYVVVRLTPGWTSRSYHYYITDKGRDAIDSWSPKPASERAVASREARREGTEVRRGVESGVLLQQLVDAARHLTRLSVSDMKQLRAGTYVLVYGQKKLLRVRVTSVKMWVRAPNRVQVNVQYGLREHATFNGYDDVFADDAAGERVLQIQAAADKLHRAKNPVLKRTVRVRQFPKGSTHGQVRRRLRSGARGGLYYLRKGRRVYVRKEGD